MSLLAKLAMAVLTLGMVALVGLGVSRSARLAGRDASSARRSGLAVSFGLLLWLAATAIVASTGLLSVWTARPPRFPLVPIAALVAVILLARSHAVKALAVIAPRHWPIAAQTFRIGVELVLFTLHEAGRAPRRVTFEGRNFDILVGLTAPFIAWLVARRRATPTLVGIWNVLGLALLANAARTIVTSVPGPLRFDGAGESFEAIATWPFIWLPAFLAPLAAFFHLVSLGQTRRPTVPTAPRSGS